MRLILILAAMVGIASAQRTQLPADFAEKLAALEQSRREHPDDLKILDALAGSYSMAAQYRKAIAVVQHMRALAPQDHALQLRQARNYAWTGDTKRAIAEYVPYLRAVPGDRQATIELIRLRRYRGDYSQAERLCNQLLSTNPDDAEVLALKAEVLHWAGNRGLLARRTADRSAALAPTYPDAQVAQIYASRDLGENGRASYEFSALKKMVENQGGISAEATYRDAYKLLEGLEARPAGFWIRPGFSVYNDSDGIHDSAWGGSVEQRIGSDHKLILEVTRYASSAPTGSIFTDGREWASLNNFRIGGQLRIAPATYVTLLAGGASRGFDGAPRPIFNLQLTASPIDRWTFDISAGRDFLAVTPRAIDRNMSSYSVAGSAQFAMNSRTFLTLRADRRYWSDANQSITGDVTVRRVLRYNRRFSVDAGLLSHAEHFERDTQLEAGFFTPDRYFRHDGFLGVRGELGKLRYELRGAGGAQQVVRRADYRPDWEATSTVSVGLGRVLRLSGGYQRRNYSLVSKDGWYQGLQFSLGIQP